MKNITINIPSSSIDQNLYQYDGLYRENQLISKELDKDIQQSITFENDTPVNFKVKTTPFASYNSFLPDSNLYSLDRIVNIKSDNEDYSIYSKNNKSFIIRKVTLPQLNITEFEKNIITEEQQDTSNQFRKFFTISTNLDDSLKADTVFSRNFQDDTFNISTYDNFGLQGHLNNVPISSKLPLYFGYTSGSLTAPDYVGISSNNKYVTLPTNPIVYNAKDNTKLDGTYEDIAITPPNAQLGDPSMKLVQVPLFTTQASYSSKFNTRYSLQTTLAIDEYPVLNHAKYASNTQPYIQKTYFPLLSSTNLKIVSYYSLDASINNSKLVFIGTRLDTDKSAKFYTIDLDKSTFGIQMPTESKNIPVTFVEEKEDRIIYKIAFDVVTGAMLKKWPSEKHGKPVYVIFQPNIKFKPKTATVNLKLEFNCADKSLNVDDLKNALSLIMEDGEWKTTQTSREYTGNIADVIPD